MSTIHFHISKVKMEWRRPIASPKWHIYDITCWRFLVKHDLICLRRPNCKDENYRNWILLLWTFHRNHRFRCIFTMFRETFHEKSLFHIKPSRVTFDWILSFLLGCLQATYSFIFGKKHDPASFYSVDIALSEFRSEIINLDKPAGWPNRCLLLEREH